jgi:copper(I)-binding protein
MMALHGGAADAAENAGGESARQSTPPRGAGLLAVDEPWVRGTVEGQTGSGAYMRLTSREDAQLVGVSSAVADRVELHEMRVVNDMMTMRRVERLALPANKTVSLEHDYHVMFIGLRRQLHTGENVTLHLQLLDARGRHHTIDVLAPVRPLNTAQPQGSGTGARP